MSHLCYSHPNITKSNAPVIHKECNQTKQKSILDRHVIRMYSQNNPNKNRQILPTIISYFSSAQREIRERRADCIPLFDENEKNYIHRVYSLRAPGGGYGKYSPILSMLYTVQTVNLMGLITAGLATGFGMMGKISVQIPWNQDSMVLDQIALGIISVTTSLMVFTFVFALWRFPVR